MTLSHISDVLPAAVPHRVRTLDDLLQDFEAQEALENPDAVVPMRDLRLTADGTLAIPSQGGTFAFSDWSKLQLASRVGVRWDRWFARMSPEEQAAEVNKRLWSTSEKLRVRTSRVTAKPNGAVGTVRALVSPTFSPIPDSQLLRLLKTALEPVESDLRIVRSDMTERTTTYVLGLGRPFRPGDDHEVGDIWGGLLIRNSGVGFAAALLMASFTRLLCKNGMTAPIPNAVLLRRAHRAFDIEKLRDALVERLRDLPGRLKDAARVLAASRDHGVVDPKGAFVEILKKARLPARLVPDFFHAYDAEPALKGSAFGVSQAVTRAAQGLSPEERLQLEHAAGEYVAHLSRAN